MRRWLGAVVLSLLSASALTFSRGLVGFSATLALIGFFAPETATALRRSRVALAVMFGLLLACGTMVSLYAVVPVGLQRSAAGSWDLKWNETPAAYRVLHAAALRMFMAQGWFGVGPGGFPERVDEYTTPEERRSSWPSVHDGWTAHSFWLRWAAETGLVGLMGWLILFGWALNRLRHRGQLGRVAACSLLGLFLNGLHVDFSHLKFIWAYVGLIAGASVGCVHQRYLVTSIPRSDVVSK